MLPISFTNLSHKLVYFYLLGYLTISLKVLAQEEPTGYVLLEPSALTGVGVSSSTPTDLMTYLKGAYQTLFVVIFSAAIIMVVWAGFEYMLTDVVTTKGNAKKRLENAVWGLVIIGLSYLVLYIINPDLVNFELELPFVDKIQTNSPNP